jgi:excisionase family DNA binding protein
MAGEVLTLREAAAYLRLSKSTLYQRKDIPRYRLPGSREVRFIKQELTAWLKSSPTERHSPASEAASSPLDTVPGSVYHRSARYR